jgi:hypothetical protein
VGKTVAVGMSGGVDSAVAAYLLLRAGHRVHGVTSINYQASRCCDSRSILQAKAAAAQVLVPAKVMELLATKITTNVRELEGALNRLVAHANLFGRPITIDSAHEVLHDVLRRPDKVRRHEFDKLVLHVLYEVQPSVDLPAPALHNEHREVRVRLLDAVVEPAPQDGRVVREVDHELLLLLALREALTRWALCTVFSLLVFFSLNDLLFL